MEKIDYKKQYKHLYKPSDNKVEIVEVPKWNYLMIDGKGDPNTSRSFMDAIETLYPLSYTLKFMVKKADVGNDYVVLPLEGLWWSDDMSAFVNDDKDNWQWTLMLMQPEPITQEMVKEAIETVRLKKNPIGLPLVRFESFDEGLAAQILHIGPFSEEGPTIEKIHAFIEDNGYHKRGKHHEIYLSDTRKVAPEKWKTIIRQPIS